jgi:hypothetical protein
LALQARIARKLGMPLLRAALPGFIAGFLATLIFHQGLWSLLYHVHCVPSDSPAWPLDPVPPFGVPSVISKAFWGGVWGAVLAPLLSRFRGATYWTAWVLCGALVLSLVGMYVVTAIKGKPAPTFWPRFAYAALVNGAWGFGTALVLRLARLLPSRTA